MQLTVACDGLPQADLSEPSSSNASSPSLVVRNRNKVIRKRARFNPDQRVKVNAVRKRGACLRCRLMKITCSQDDLCTTCERAAKACYALEKGTVSFIGCIRTTLAQVSVFSHVFENAFVTPTSEDMPWDFSSSRQGSSSHQPTMTRIPDVSMVTKLTSHTIQVWLPSGAQANIKTEDQRSSDVTTAAEIQSELLTILDLPVVREMKECFMTMFVLAASPMANLELFAMSGHQCLKWLDRKLKPYTLSSCSRTDLRALIFLVFGTLYSVVNATPATEHPLFPTDEETAGADSKKTLFDALKEHLCRMLLYYVSFLASKIGFERPTSFEDLAAKVASRTHGWEERAAVFLVIGLEKHGTDLFKPVNNQLRTGSGFEYLAGFEYASPGSNQSG